MEVRSKGEILQTLDRNGKLEGLPFMPQMFDYCGRRFQVYKRAHKTCDTVNRTGGRSLSSAVHLELRCDGMAHGGCQAACLLFWKEAWLTPVGRDGKDARQAGGQVGPSSGPAGCTEAEVWKGTRDAEQLDSGEPVYRCQATELPHITSYLPWWNMRQYIEDYTSGNVTVRRLIQGMAYAIFAEILEHSGETLGRVLVGLYDAAYPLWGGLPYPRKMGTIASDRSTPCCALNLQPGEIVRVKSYPDILATLNTAGKNRGLSFDGEQLPFCGGTYRVRSRVRQFIDEATGRMKTLKNDAIILDGVWCEARYSNCRMLCPRSIYSWWREIWLERVAENPAGTGGVSGPERTRP